MVSLWPVNINLGGVVALELTTILHIISENEPSRVVLFLFHLYQSLTSDRSL